MAIKVLVNGAFGKMGQLTVQAIKAKPTLEIVGETVRGHDLAKAIADSKAEVVVDFTHPSSVFENCMTIINAGVHPVIGTTGLNTKQIQQLQKQCAQLKLGAIIAPNFSLAAVLLMKYAQAIAKYLPEVEIIESHHPKKADSPSGTALYTAEMLTKARSKKPEEHTPLHETLTGARGANYDGIPIHAVRLPGLLAHLEVVFGNIGETLTLRHDSIDRACFMPGVCFACEKVVTLNEMIYGLEKII